MTLQKSQVIPLYYRDIRKSTPLSKAEELILIKEAQDGNIQSRDKLVIANLKYTVRVARGFQNQGLELPDLINEGNLGMFKAVDHFDLTSHQVKFITYADSWIKQAILAALKQQVRTIDVPTNVQSDYITQKKIREKLEADPSNDTVTDEDVAAHIGHLDANGVRNRIDECSYASSLDDPIGDKNDTKIDLYIPPGTNLSKDDREVNKRFVTAALVALKPRNREVVKMFYGIDIEYPMSNVAIAQKFGWHSVGIGHNYVRVNQILRESIVDMQKFFKRNNVDVNKLKF